MTTMLRQRNLLIALTSAAVIAGVAGCDASITAHQIRSSTAGATTSPAPPAPPAGASSACAALGGTIDAKQTCRVQSATATYKIDMSFPLDYPDPQAVTGFLTQDRERFVNWVAQYGQRDARDRPFVYRVTAKTYRSGTPILGTQSLVLEIDNDTGFAHQGHPDTTFQAFNYDLGKHVPITFDTLFKPGTKPLEVLNPIVQRKFDALPDDLDVHAYQNFAITDDAVIFFFGQDQVVHDNGGPHQISVPRAVLQPLLA
jgi:Protein of unknown function (DUF3298)